ncbi:MAG: DUF6629 family protein [Phenylobacterium sp.]
MCFSPTASFITAAVTGLAGVIAMTRVRHPRELPLAATPILFALQQTLEGLLWLKLPLAPDGPAAQALALGFLIFAECFWPLYAPLAVLAIEPENRRRRLILPWLAVGAAVSAYLLWQLLIGPHKAVILHDHMVYQTQQRHIAAVGTAYLAAVSLPLLMSSRRTIQVLGTIVLVGCAVAYIFYWAAFQSVWCFFAAAASAVIAAHFEWARRNVPRVAEA